MGTLKFGKKMKKEIFYNMEIELDEDVKQNLLRYGRSEIVNDENEILNYIIIKLLRKKIAEKQLKNKWRLKNDLCQNLK